MKIVKILKSMTAVLAVAVAVGARGDDTDIYMSTNSSAVGEPFLMLVLDWRPDVIGSNACKYYAEFSIENGGCDKQFGFGPIGHMIRHVNEVLHLTQYSDGDSIAPSDAFRAVFAAFLLGYKVLKRDSSGNAIDIGGIPCSDTDPRPECFNSYPGIGKPEPPANADANGVNIGLMLSHANKGSLASCEPVKVGTKWREGCSNGGYVLKGFETIEDDDYGSTAEAHKPLYRTLQKLYALPQPTSGQEAHFYQPKEIYAELNRYLTGEAILNGHRGYQDFGTSGTSLGGNCGISSTGDGTTNLDASCEGGSAAKPYSWDSSIESGGNYTAPLASAHECSKLFAVNTVSGQTNQDSDSDLAIQTDMGLGAKPTFPDVLAYMYQANNLGSEFGLTSYFLSQSSSQTVNGWAAAGGTAAAIPYASDLNQLLIALQSIGRQILSVSTTFVAASVPVSAFNRVLTDENYYIALFRSDPGGNRYWPGNLKRLKVQVDTLDDGTKQLRLVARNPSGTGVMDAFDPNDGRLNWDALTYWTDQAALPPKTDPMYQSVPENVDFMVAEADGRVVERGGAGQKIPGAIAGNSPGLANGANARMLYTEPLDAVAGGSNGLIPVNVNSTTLQSDAQLQSLLGVPGDSARALKLLRYMRGLETTGSGANQPGRKWIMGSAIHSRPVPINYGLRNTGDTAPDIRLFLGTNDGWFRQFKNSDGSGADLGSEVFAFMPHESMGIQKYLVASDPFAADDTSFTELSPQSVLYGVDGPVTAYLEYGSDNAISTSATEDKAYVYFGMRRGGTGYYAFNVKNPDAPRLAWTAKKADADFNELGMTFSQPVLARVKFDHNSASDIRVLIFGGGYNGGWSGSARVGKDAGSATDNQGNAIYMVNAETGALIWKAVKGASTGASSNTVFTHSGLDHSIPSDVAVIDINGDGYHDAAFVGDTGSNVWRVDFPSHLTDVAATNNRQLNWKLTKLATLASSGTASADQRFFSAPEVVRSRDLSGDFIAVALGSGNREDPLDKLDLDSDPMTPNVPQNWFYLVKDRNVFSRPTSDGSITHSDLDDITDDCITADACTAGLADGWKLELDAGEKAITDPVVRLGTLFFTTYVPPDESDSCAPAEGGSYLYAVSLATGAPMKNYDIHGDVLNELDRRREVGGGVVPPPPPLIPPGLIGDIFMFPGDEPEDIIKIPPLPVFWYEGNVDK